MNKVLFFVSIVAISFVCNDRGKGEFAYEDWDTDQNDIIDN